MLDLYVPICRDPGRVATLGHLGQSIDGFIAGEDGESAGLNGPENILHLHRLRALFDVVMVGRQTATSDDPQLTTRLAEGPDPVRVVLDPNLECDPNLGLFGDDRATTLLLCATDAPLRSYPAQTAVRRLKCSSDSFSATEALSLLHAEGLTRVFIEGGGRTVSMALAEGVLDRLHIAVAPVFIGQGVRGVTVPGGPRFVDALRPPCTRFEMGRDVLFDFDLHPQRP
jgi:riboflavin-specific deaminase-like protein